MLLDIICEIFKFLDRNELEKCQLVKKSWDKIIKGKALLIVETGFSIGRGRVDRRRGETDDKFYFSRSTPKTGGRGPFQSSGTGSRNQKYTKRKNAFPSSDYLNGL